MNPDRVITEAVARWIACGPRSTGHPLLAHALETWFHPVGIRADWLEAEPFGALDSDEANCWLARPRWLPDCVDVASPGAADLCAHAGLAPQSCVDAAGVLHLPPSVADPWPAVRHTVRAGAEAGAFIHAAATLLLIDPEAAALYAEGDDAAYAKFVGRWLAAARATPANPTDAPAMAAIAAAEARDRPGTIAGGK